MKKIIIALLSVFLIIGLFIACDGDSDEKLWDEGTGKFTVTYKGINDDQKKISVASGFHNVLPNSELELQESGAKGLYDDRCTNFKKEDYSFYGWQDSKTGRVYQYNKNPEKNESARINVTGDVVLNAIWKNELTGELIDGDQYNILGLREEYKSTTDLMIPRVFTSWSDTGSKDFLITKIAQDAFKGNKELKSVVIPDSIKSIGENAFNGCTSLTSIEFRSVEAPEIGENSLPQDNQNLKIYVPKESETVYKSEPSWTSYTDTTKVQQDTIKPIIHVLEVTLNKQNFTLQIGATETLTYTLSPEDAEDKTIEWSSTTPTVAEVDQTGKVTAVSKGTTKIVALSKDLGKTSECTVTVEKKAGPAAIDSTKLTITKPTAAGASDAKITGSVLTTLTEFSINGGTSWTDVTTAGEITGLKAGTVKIRIKETESLEAGASIDVVIGEGDVLVTGITVTPTSITLAVDDSKTITPKVSPENATNKNVIWTTSNTNIATVSNGTVTAIATGTTTITAKTEDGYYTAECVITVEKKSGPAALDSTKLSITKPTAAGASNAKIAGIVITSATEYSVDGGTSWNDVTTTGEITGLKAGTVKIRIKETDKAKAGTIIDIVVPEYGSTDINVTGVTLNSTSLSLTVGSTETITATVSPGNATNKNISWTSGNIGVATVTNGIVNAIAQGTTTITATTEDGGFTATCSVTVSAKSETATKGSATVTGQTAGRTSCSWVQLWKDGPKFATFNVGSTVDSYSTPANYNESIANHGKRYYWGGSVDFESGNPDSCQLTEISLDISGTSYDTATRVWGNNWRMPTAAMYTSLTDGLSLPVEPSFAVSGQTYSAANTDWIYYDGETNKYNGTSIPGWKISGKNEYSENSIFMPASSYWTANGGFNENYGPFSSYYIFVPYSVGQNIGNRICDYYVRAVYDPVKAITSISLDKTSLTSTAGKSETLTLTINPADATSKFVIWTSSNEDVATVENGVITCNDAGTAVITVKTPDGNFSANCTVTVQAAQSPYGSVGTAKATSRTDVQWVQLWKDGPKFATFNVGSTIDDYSNVTGYIKANIGGAYYWGGRQELQDYCMSTATNLDISATSYDTATRVWGTNWRMPTAAMYTSLTDGLSLPQYSSIVPGKKYSASNTTWVYYDVENNKYNGSYISGWKISGKGDYAANSIFLPNCIYWTSEGYYYGYEMNGFAYIPYQGVQPLDRRGQYNNSSGQYYGAYVRAVYNPVEDVSVNEIAIAASNKTTDAATPIVLTAILTPSDVVFNDVVWTADKANVVSLYSYYGSCVKIVPNKYEISTTTDVVITATTEDGNHSATCTITITPVPSYNLVFDSKGGSDVTTMSVPKNEIAQKPANPTKSGVGFSHWTTDSNAVLSSPAFDFENTIITANTTLYAVWKSPYSYIYPVYNTDGDATSGIKEWKTSSTTDYEVVQSSSSSVTWNAGWYVVDGNVNLSAGAVCNGAVNLLLANGCTLTASGSYNSAGISVTGSSSLSIYAQTTGTDMGSLAATGGENAAGIGGNNFCNGENITINGGKITVTGGEHAAGIGGGCYGYGSYITINGGKVSAAGGWNGSAIGSGENGNNSTNILVSSYLSVKAENSADPTEEIDNSSDDIASALRGMRYCEIDVAKPLDPVSYLYPVYKTSGNPVSGVDHWEETVTTNYKTVKSKTSSVTWKTGWYVVSGNINLSNGVTCDGAVNLILTNDSNLTVTAGYSYQAGISVTTPSSLTIYVQTTETDHEGKLSATGGNYSQSGAGIGGGYCSEGNNITINGGAIFAKGGGQSAGIGGGYAGSGSNIVINEGIIITTGSDYSAGIGGGRGRTGNSIVINGGTITAIGGKEAAGIGGGYEQSGENITINGGTITATGGAYGAGIGGGNQSIGQNINISGGVVFANGGESASGIGSGYLSWSSAKSSDITVDSKLTIKVGKTENPVARKVHDSETDVSSALDGKRYCVIEVCDPLDPIPYLSPVYKTIGEPTSGIDHWETLSTTNYVFAASSDVAETWDEGWYIISGNINLCNGVTCDGAVNLILTRDSNLTVTAGSTSKAGISVTTPSSLTIYVQTTETDHEGKLSATGGSAYYQSGAGIGGDYGSDGNNITINGGAITAKGGIGGSGIGGGYETNGSNITINAGSITTTGGNYGSGIGGGYEGNGANITINAGSIITTGGISGAGIGGGRRESSTGGIGSDIIINGGTINANGGNGYLDCYSGSGIGGGAYGAAANITINDGAVTATGGIYNDYYNGAGIGGGYKGTASNILVNGGNVSAIAGYYASAIGSGANSSSSSSEIKVSSHLAVKAGTLANPYRVSHESETDIASNLNEKRRCIIEAPITLSPVSYMSPVYNTEGVVTSGIKYWETLSTSDYNYVVSSSDLEIWDSGFYVFEEGVTLSKGAECNGAVNLVLTNNCQISITGANRYAGIAVTAPNSLTIYSQTTGSDMGVMTVSTNESGCAGIGGSNRTNKESGCNITINGGKITSTGCASGAGIGGGYKGNGSNITINGGEISATSGANGAGIGGGYNGIASNIVINGGLVNATAASKDTDYGGAGIGGGCYGSATDIIFNGGNISAKGVASAAGIGGGDRGSTSNISFYNGTINATGSKYGAGIGSGHYGNASNISIYNGTINATGGKFGAGIGGGSQSSVNKITISGGIVIAQCGSGGGAGIGGGFLGDGNNITITGGTIITTGSDCTDSTYRDGGGAGIGGGAEGEADNLTITGGVITATGGAGGPGIGCGSFFKKSDITIDGGTISATGGKYGAGIGSGYSETTCSVTVNGGSITATGGEYAAGIGGGYSKTASSVIVNGGTITATGGNSASAFGIAYGNNCSAVVKISSDLVVKAGNSENPTEVIEHTSTTDLSSNLNFKLYCTIE